MRARVRKDLHDQDSSNYRWADAVLDRHITRAVQELSLSVPLQKTAELTATAGSRDLALSSLAGLVSIQAVECPVDRYPRSYARFSVWEDTLTLLVDSPPAGGETVRVFYGALHTLDGSSSTVPPWTEDLVATGGAAYAAIEWANYAINRVNVGGEDIWRHYMSWGQGQLARFLKDLALLGRRGALHTRRLYAPADLPASQTTDWGP
jgi:hypothetical protein